MTFEELRKALMAQAMREGRDPAEVDMKLEKYLQLTQKRQILQNNQILTYHPNPAQQEMHAAATKPGNRIRIWFGGNRGGKSWFLATEATAYALGRRMWYPQNDPMYLTPFRPPTLVRIASTPQELRETIAPYIRMCLPRHMIKSTRKNQDGIEMFYELTNGSRITLYSYEMDDMAYEGSRAHFWGFNEPVSRSQWIGAWRGLTDFEGHAVFCMTPVAQPWLQRDLVSRAKAGDPMIFFGQYSTYTNLGFGLTESGIKALEASLTTSERKTRIDGESLHLQGLVADEFSPDVHVVRFNEDGVLGNSHIQFPRDWFPNKMWNRMWGCYAALDPHYRKNIAYLMAGVDPMGTIHLHRELWTPYTDVYSLSDQIKEVESGLFMVNKFIDPMAKQPDLTDSTRSMMAVLHELGHPFLPGSKDRLSGIYQIKDHLKVSELDGRKIPKIVVWDDGAYPVRRLQYEWDQWTWEDAEQADPESQKIKAKAEYDDQNSNLYRILLVKPQCVNRSIFERDLHWTPAY